MAANEGEGVTRRSLIAGGLSIGASFALNLEPAYSQSYEKARDFDWSDVRYDPPYIKFDNPYIHNSYPVQLDLTNPNIKATNGRIVEFYGIRAEDVTKLRSHPHSNEHDPYAGYKNRVDESCCDKTDCGPAKVQKVGMWKDEDSGKYEEVYAYGIMLDGQPAFAISIPTVTEIYSKDPSMGEEPDHGCIFRGVPMCLFLTKTA